MAAAAAPVALQLLLVSGSADDSVVATVVDEVAGVAQAAAVEGAGAQPGKCSVQ